MDVKDLKVPAGALVAAAAAGWAAYEIIATKKYVAETRAPLQKAVVVLQEQSTINAKNSSRSLSLQIADKLSYYYNELCYNT